MKVGGKAWGHNYLRHEDLVRGARIVFDMASEPATGRGTAAEDRPYSFSR